MPELTHTRDWRIKPNRKKDPESERSWAITKEQITISRQGRELLALFPQLAEAWIHADLDQMEVNIGDE